MIIDSHAHYNNSAYKKPFRYLTYNKDGYALKEGGRDQLFQELLDADIPYSIEPGVSLESGNEVLEPAAQFIAVGDQGGIDFAFFDEGEDLNAVAAVDTAGFEGQVLAVHIRQALGDLVEGHYGDDGIGAGAVPGQTEGVLCTGRFQFVWDDYSVIVIENPSLNALTIIDISAIISMNINGR